MTKKLYEAMFLVDSAQAASDWDGTMAAVKRVLERADAEVVYLEKWVDRRLAYEITHKARGTYILCYFKAEGTKIAGIEKDVNLSEQIMRVLILTAEDRKGDSVRRDCAGETKAPQEMYNRDDRRPDSRRRHDAPSDKAEAKDKPSAEAKSTDAPKKADDEAETPAPPEQGKPAEEASVSGDAESAGETPAPVAPEQDAPVEEATAAGDAGAEAEPAKE
jgi:small subunit ribosomal protein S6